MYQCACWWRRSDHRLLSRSGLLAAAWIAAALAFGRHALAFPFLAAACLTNARTRATRFFWHTSQPTKRLDQMEQLFVRNQSQSNGMSSAIWDHTMFTDARRRWTCPALTPADQAGRPTLSTYPGGMKGWVDLGVESNPGHRDRKFNTLTLTLPSQHSHEWMRFGEVANGVMAGERESQGEQ